MEIIYKPDSAALDEIAIQIFTDTTKKVLGEKHFAVWALPGGRSVPAIFNKLSSISDIDWKRVHFFMVDERLVPIDDMESNYRLLKETLLDKLLEKELITHNNIHPFIFRPGKKDPGTISYRAELEKFGGSYDLVFLSSGEDGHIAGLYPAHHSIEDNAPFFLTMDDSPKLPVDRMTSSRSLILRSRSSILLFYGNTKRDALDLFKNNNISYIDCPAKITYQIKHSYALTDQR